MAAVAGLRTLDSVPGVGKLFVIAARNRLVPALMQMGDENPRMFKMFMGPKPLLVVTHPELARSVLTRPQDFIKSPPLEAQKSGFSSRLNFTSDGTYASVVMTNGAEWQAMRKPIDPAFEKAELRKFVPKFNDAAGKLLESWKSSDQIDAKRDMSRFALDVLGSAVLGRDFGAIDGTFDDTYAQYQIVMQELMNPLYFTFPVLERLPLPRNIAYKKAIDHMYSVLDSAVQARRQQRVEQHAAGTLTDEPNDMLDMLLGPGVDAKTVLPDGYTIPMLWLFFLAGHDTTAVALAWTMHFLAANPEVQAKARAEAFATLKGKTDPDADDLEKVPYINAVVNESLRLRPPIYNLLTRDAAHDTELDGVALPKGTGVSLHIGAINTHPEVWERPKEFDPERFMQEKQPRVFNNLPFSAGPRRCLGDKFSLLEQRALLLKMLTQYELLPDGDMAKQERTFSNASIAIMFLQPEELKIRVRPL
ncbi:unnamed protein product [Effrenium voratum]|nr:unnamed protein product [Effrenium voratum]